MTSPLQINRYDRLVRRLMNLVGEGAIVTGVLPDVFPVIEMENLETDSWKLAGWNLCVGYVDHTPATGLNAEIALENITTTGILAAVEQIDVAVDTDALITLGVNAVGSTLVGSDVGNRRVRDFRPDTDQIPSLAVTSGDAIPLTLVARWRVLANRTFTIRPPKGVAVLIPGSMLIVKINTVNVRGDVTYWWRERGIDASENNF